MQISHYVCTECGFTSKFAGTCQNESCIRQGTRLVECHCQDGLHEMVIHPQAEEVDDDNPEKQKKEAADNDYSVNTVDLDELQKDSS